MLLFGLRALPSWRHVFQPSAAFARLFPQPFAVCEVLFLQLFAVCEVPSRQLSVACVRRVLPCLHRTVYGIEDLA